jgi:hypothetical protein
LAHFVIGTACVDLNLCLHLSAHAHQFQSGEWYIGHTYRCISRTTTNVWGDVRLLDGLDTGLRGCNVVVQIRESLGRQNQFVLGGLD